MSLHLATPLLRSSGSPEGHVCQPIRAALLVALLLGVTCPALGQACPDGQVVGADTAGHCCWPGQAWSSSRAVCVGMPECPTQFAAEGEACRRVSCPPGQTLSGDRCLETCRDGQTMSPSTQGHCCWEGQAWSSARSACVGEPTRCPTGLEPQGESCGVPACESGRSISAETNGHCCWSGQVWSESRSLCVGRPTTCPPGTIAGDDGCDMPSLAGGELVGCPVGQQIGPETGGHCCWPGQAWSTSRAMCVGLPTACPGGMRAEGDACAPSGEPNRCEAGDCARHSPAPALTDDGLGHNRIRFAAGLQSGGTSTVSAYNLTHATSTGAGDVQVRGGTTFVELVVESLLTDWFAVRLAGTWLHPVVSCDPVQGSAASCPSELSASLWGGGLELVVRIPARIDINLQSNDLDALLITPYLSLGGRVFPTLHAQQPTFVPGAQLGLRGTWRLDRLLGVYLGAHIRFDMPFLPPEELGYHPEYSEWYYFAPCLGGGAELGVELAPF